MPLAHSWARRGARFGFRLKPGAGLMEVSLLLVELKFKRGAAGQMTIKISSVKFLIDFTA